jgi:hypothetical protein
VILREIARNCVNLRDVVGFVLSCHLIQKSSSRLVKVIFYGFGAFY